MKNTMRNIASVLVSISIISMLTGCSTANNTDDEVGKLPAVEIKDNYISPDGGINIDVAKELVVKYLTENEYKGDIASSIEIKEITVEQAWENNKMQLYSIELDYAWLNGIAVISEGEVIGVLPGMPTISVYLADINDDFKYEVCTNALFGSGFIDMRIHVLDTQNLEQYELSKRFEYDLVLGIDDKALVVYRDDAAVDEKILLGRLLLENGQLLIADE